MIQVRKATQADAESIAKLLPRLSSFNIPDWRTPEDLWAGDLRLFERWLQGEEPHCFVLVAVESEDFIAGVAIVSLGGDALNKKPSSHLEVIAVSELAEGKGVGRTLITHAEEEARNQGALTMSLNVFETNSRARTLYEKLGYSTEWIRYIKPLHE